MAERDPQQPTKLALKEVAETWTSTLPDNIPSRGDFDEYDTMADTFFERTRQALPVETDARQYISGNAALAGFRVTGRFMYAGALHASEQNMSIEQLGRALYAPESFRSLQLLTREWNDSAIAIESNTGLSGPLFPNDDRMAREFTLTEEGLQFTRYAIHSYIARDKLVDRGYVSSKEAFTNSPEESTVRCLGHRAGVLAHIYRHMLTISATDPRLFQATLANK